MTGPGPEGRVSPWAVLGVLGFVAGIHAAWLVLGDTIVGQGGLADGDSFTHLIRAERLWRTGDWFDVAIPDANAPFGTTVHWTRLFDIALFALAIPMLALVDTTQAIYLAGAAISPLLHLALAAATIWAVRPLFGPAAAVAAGALTGTQFGILAFAIAGRADHHMLFALFAMLALGGISRAMDPTSPDAGRRAARLAGLCLAAGVWVGPEFLLFTVIAMAGMAMPWLRGVAASTERNLGLAQGFAVGLLIFCAIERGPALISATAFDRLSAFHVVLGGLVWLFWVVVQVVDRRRRLPASFAGRTVFAGIGALATAAAVGLLFPAQLSNPLTRDNPEIVPIFRHIAEYGGVHDVAQFLIYFGTVLLVGPWLIWRLRGGLTSRQGGTWLIVAVSLLVYTAIGVGWIRWSLYAALFLTVLLSALIVELDAAIDRQFGLPGRIPVKVIVLAAVIIGPLGVAGSLRYADRAADGVPAKEAIACPIGGLSKFLNAPPWSAKPRVIVASANFGPELIYRTAHKAVATVHHRNIAGILDGHRILGGGDDAAVRALIERRQVDLLVLCPGSKNDGYFLNEGETNHLYGRLVDGKAPPWVRAVPLPPELAGRLRLFEAQRRR